MADYSNFISLAQRLIAKKGAPMTYVSVRDHGEVDPHTGKRPVDVEAFEVIGVCTKPTKDELQAGYFKGLSMVILVEGQAIKNASTKDIIQFGEHDFNIREIVRVAPAGDCILYKFGVEDGGSCRA